MKAAKIFVFFIILAYVGVFSNAESFSDSRDFRRIYVARHGQRTPGADPSLTRLGVEQAKLLAQRIQEIGFKGKIYVSPYLRAVETASEISKLLGVKMILTPEIQERTHKEGIPDIKGRSLAELDKLFPSLISKDSKLSDNWVYADNFGEKLDARVAETIEEALEGDCGNFILVGHKATVKAALKYLCKKSQLPSGYRDLELRARLFYSPSRRLNKICFKRSRFYSSGQSHKQFQAQPAWGKTAKH